MEWYFGSDGDDLVVPKDREPLDRLPSPNSWSDWGISEFPRKDFDGKGFCEEIDINISSHEMECSSNSSMSYGLHNSLHQWAALTRRQPDYQISDIARMDQMDDIYLNSLLDEDVATDNLYGSSSFSPPSQYSMMSADNPTTEKILESEHTPSQIYGLGGSRYTKTHGFSPTVDWNREFVTFRPYVKAQVLKDSAPSEHDNEGGYVCEETSPEESALQELERVTAKLTARTRNCFRDSLYRLAENSKKQTVNQDQNGDHAVENNLVKSVRDDTLRCKFSQFLAYHTIKGFVRLVHTVPNHKCITPQEFQLHLFETVLIRVGEAETRESKTNAIDRAIASLMLTKIDFCAEESPGAATLDFQGEVNETTERLHNSLDKPCSYSFTMLAGDAEVPIIGKEKLLLQSTNLRGDFSGVALKILSRH